MPIIRAVIGIIANYLGDHAAGTFRWFWFLKPKGLDVQTIEELENVNEEKVEVIPIGELKEEMQSGDIILFVGKNDKHYHVSSKWGTWSCFSHIGMVLRKDNQVFILEVILEGVTLKPLKKRVLEYPSQLIAYRKLIIDNGIDRDKVLWDMYEDLKDRDYENKGNPQLSPLEIFKAAVDIYIPFTNRDLLSNKSDLGELFCSEIIAEGYMRMGLIPKGKDSSYPSSNEYVPADFSSYTPRNTPEIQLVKNMDGGYLEQEVFIDMQNSGDPSKDVKHNKENRKNTTDELDVE